MPRNRYSLHPKRERNLEIAARWAFDPKLTMVSLAEQHGVSRSRIGQIIESEATLHALGKANRNHYRRMSGEVVCELAAAGLSNRIIARIMKLPDGECERIIRRPECRWATKERNIMRGARKCKLPSCNDPVRAYGLCNRHAQRYQHGDRGDRLARPWGKLIPRKDAEGNPLPCITEGCTRDRHASGRCSACWNYWRGHTTNPPRHLKGINR